MPDVGIHLAGGVDVAHPVVAIGMDAEARERLDEPPGMVPRVGRVAVGLLVGHVGERPAHLALDRVGGQQRLGVHRVEVVDAVQQGRLEAAGAQGPGDDVEDDRAAQGADVDGAGRRLAVVDDLGAADARRPARPPNPSCCLASAVGLVAGTDRPGRGLATPPRALALADLGDVYVKSPAGTWTTILSPLRWPRSARPTGDSLEIRPSVGLASVEPTIVKVSPRPRRRPPRSSRSGRGPSRGARDERRVLDERLERLDPALDERLLVLGVLVLRVLGEVAVLLGVVDPRRDLGPADIGHLGELRAELVEAFLRQVGRLVHGAL